MDKADRKNQQIRILLIGVFFCLLFALIIGRAVHLQIIQAKQLSDKAGMQHRKSFVNAGKRGTIYDSSMNKLAVSFETVSVGVLPRKIKDKEKTATVLSDILGMKRSIILKKLKSSKNYMWIGRQIPLAQANTLKAKRIGGIEFSVNYDRKYPHKTLAAQVIGFTGTDDKGLEGIEYRYNNILNGSTSRHLVQKDGKGQLLYNDKIDSSDLNGNNIVLTIDQTVQYITENALQEAVINHQAKSGMALVMNPKTGAIKAIAHFPVLNPNSFAKFNRDTWRNRAITDPFEPGSTMKIFLAATALENNYCKPDSIFYCENGSYRVDRDVIHDTHPYDWLSLSQIIRYSSNIGVTKVSEKTGKKALYNMLTSFGFGNKTGIDCPGETSGILSHYLRWSNIDTSAIAFGQGVSVSAVQLLTAASAIANGGKLMRPYIVKEITSENGDSISKTDPVVIRRVVSEKTAKSVRKMMYDVVNRDGTGVNAALENYSVCGKTGTAQKTDSSGKYSKNTYTGSFLGFAPAENPELTVLVVIDEPKEEHYGGIVAAPAFRKIIRETFNYMNIHSDIQTDTLASAPKRKKRG